jgi:ParB-like chromosome segregation protein Spo0J
MTSLTRVRPHPSNPRNGDVDAIAASILANGYIAPIIAQKSTGHILAGNHRYHALLSLGADVAPVIWVDVDEQAATRYLLADNRTSDLGQYDNAQLVELLEQLAEQDDLMGSGYNEHDLEALRALAEIEPDYGDHASWPTITLTVPPHLKNAFYEFTEHAVSDHDRLEMLLRLAGWQEEK